MPSKQEQYLDNCLNNNNIAGFFKAIEKWNIAENVLSQLNQLKQEWIHGNISSNFEQRLRVFMHNLEYNTHFDNEIQLETTKNQQNMGNKAEIKGDNGVIIQDVNNSWKWWLQFVVVPILIALITAPWWIQIIFPPTPPNPNPNPNPKTIKGILVDNQVPPQPVRNVSRVYLELPDGKGRIDTEVDGRGSFEFKNITVPNGTTSLNISVDVQGRIKSGREDINSNDLRNEVLNLGEVEIK